MGQSKPLGIDVSSFQGSAQNPPTNITWASVKSSGIVFAWAKATEGTPAAGYHTDADFVSNVTGAKAAGIYMGAYHFAHPESDTPAAEASFFWSTAGPYIKADGKTFMPMLDMEVFTGLVGASSYTDWANQWCSNVVADAAAQGVVIRPFIYVSACSAGNFNTNIAIWYSDIANYGTVNGGNDPQNGTPWSSCAGDAEWGAGVWHVWQYASVGAVPGVHGNCDVDVYNGTLSGLTASFIATATGAPTISSMTTNITIWQGSNATFSVTSTNTTLYQWRFNGTNIAGANTSSYSITDAMPTNGGGYAVTLSNNKGTNTSPTVFLAVVPLLSNAPGAIVAPTGMVDWWPADGNPNDLFGTIQGKPQGGFYYAPGKSGEAFHFDGSTAYISNNTTTTIPAPWTACMWVYYQRTPQTSAGLLEDGTYSLKLEQFSNTFQLGISHLGVKDDVFSPAYSVPTNTWTHLAFVATTTAVSVYANGVLKGSVTTNNFPCPREFIGAGFISSSAKVVDYVLGSVDDIMLFNRALSGTEINSIVNAGSAGLIRAPMVTSATVDMNGQFNMGLEGLTGKNYTVQSSTDLVTWITAGIVTNPNGTNVFTVAGATNTPFKFYRVYQPY